MNTNNEAALKYSSIRDRAERLSFLRKLSTNRQTLPLSLVDDILCMDIGAEESATLISVVESDSGLELEDFITRNFMKWEQDIALAGIARWMTATDRLLAHRWLCFNSLSELPQRLRYSFVSNCQNFGGARVLSINAELSKLSEFSPAFAGLLMLRCAQWRVDSHTLTRFAENVIGAFPNPNHHDRTLMEALNYLACQHAKTMHKTIEPMLRKEPWGSAARSILESLDANQRIIKEWQKLVTNKSSTGKKILSGWPQLWIRQFFTDEHAGIALQLATSNDFYSDNSLQVTPSGDLSLSANLIAGIPCERLIAGLSSISEPAQMFRAANLLESLIGVPERPAFLAVIKSALDGMKSNPTSSKDLSRALLLETRSNNTTVNADSAAFGQVLIEKNAIQNSANISFDSTGPQRWTYNHSQQDRGSLAEDVRNRKQFFDSAYRARQTQTPGNKDFWALLAASWASPQLSQLDELATLARRASPLFQIAYINTLARFKGVDAAVLKLLDFVRSPHDTELSAVVRALAGIATPRACQELVSCLTRPNMSIPLRLEAAQLLSRQDLSPVQDELRSALADLHLEKANGSAAEKLELEEAIEALVVPTSISRAGTLLSSSQDNDIPKLDLDIALSDKIISFPTMSSEVKRALRTAEFFHQQVGNSRAENTIDLSPLIDMQYKALELTFREQFEDPCNRIINQGIIQRKLDFLGYARPIPAQMDQFEGFIAGLPVINTIPYFSKFKMRKMLRSLCQFRPGKRFTLDGLKAFAIFFACFSRKNCRFGLENIFELPFKTDEETGQFVKMLHVFQDFRNRAAHEGFQPDAKNDVTGIWQSTADIFAHVQIVDAFLKQQPGNGKRPHVHRAS